MNNAPASANRQPLVSEYLLVKTPFGFKNQTTRVKVLRDLSAVGVGLFTASPANGGLDMFYEYTFSTEQIISYENEPLANGALIHKTGLVYFC